jgi:hopanoid biosynthesis associated protein HpnK
VGTGAASPPTACRLIINVDDFGWSEGVNEAVCRLHDAGVVTSTSLMVGLPAVEEAVARAKVRPGLAVGLHVALVAAPSLLPREQLPLLTGARGWFTDDTTRAALRYSFSPGCRRELRRELRAQFEAFARTGLPWSHVDSHRHLQLNQVVFHAALGLAREYQVPGFRVPEDDFSLHARLDPADAARQKSLARIFSWLCARERRVLQREGFVTTRWCYGLFRTGCLRADYLVRLVRELPDGDFELHCHPDLETEKGRAEYGALSAPEFRQALRDRDVKLATYPSLAGA